MITINGEQRPGVRIREWTVVWGTLNGGKKGAQMKLYYNLIR